MLRASQMFDPDLINLPPAPYLPKWFVPANALDASEEDAREGRVTEQREANGTIAGEGATQEPLLGLKADDPLVDNRLNGVG